MLFRPIVSGGLQETYVMLFYHSITFLSFPLHSVTSSIPFVQLCHTFCVQEVPLLFCCFLPPSVFTCYSGHSSSLLSPHINIFKDFIKTITKITKIRWSKRRDLFIGFARREFLGRRCVIMHVSCLPTLSQLWVVSVP